MVTALLALALPLIALPAAAEFDPVTLEGMPQEKVVDNLKAYTTEAEFLEGQLSEVVFDPRDCRQILTRFRISALELSRAIHDESADVEAASRRANRAVFDLRTLCQHDRTILISNRDKRFAAAVLNFTGRR